MENKTQDNLSLSNNNIKSKSIQKLDKAINHNPLSNSINAHILNHLGIILSPSSFLSRNSERDIYSIKQINEGEKSINKIKLIKTTKEHVHSILPNISTQKTETKKNLFLRTNKSSKILTKKKLENNFSTNKTTMNSIKQTSKEEKNKIRKISTAYLFYKSLNMAHIHNINKIDKKKSNKKKDNEEIKINKNKDKDKDNKPYNYTEYNYDKLINKKLFYSSQKNINQKNNNNKTLIDDFLNSKNGIFNLSNFNRKLLSKNIKAVKSIYNKKKENSKNIINKIKKHNLFSQIKKENDLMKKEIKKDYNAFNEFKKQYYLKKPNENTYEGFSKIYYKYNKDRSKKENIYTNRLITLNWRGDNSLQNIDYKEKIEKMKKDKLNNIFLNSKGRQIFNYDNKNENRKLTQYELANLSSRANRQVEKLFPDMLAFNLPKVFKDNRTYTIKLLYDVFIEFKTLLKLCILSNKDVNIHNKGIDFETFFNCNTKINQQGEGLSKKIFKTLNNKVEKKHLPWGNYIDGMMRMKDPDMNNKMDLFFEILDENGDGSLDYNEVYNLSLVSLQRTLSQNPLDILKKSEKEKKNQKEVIAILAEFFSKMIFTLVNIDIKDEIPIDTLRKKMQEGGEAAEYLEMFLGADNFA